MIKYRINIVLFFLLLVCLFTVFKLFDLQISKNQYYQALAQGQQSRQTFVGNRGEVFFQSGEFLASNNIVYHAFSNSNNVIEKIKTAELLSDILSLQEQEVLEKLNRSSSFVYIKKNLSEEEIDLLNQESIPGIAIEKEFVRQYLNGPMASQVIGFVGGEGIGQYGIEGRYDEVLRPQEAVTKWGLAGQILGLETKETNGANIYLTIDYNIQFIAESLLEQAHKNHNIKSGSLIVMDPQTGAIMALANFPNFDPNFYSQETNFQVFKNPVIQKIFEPGSTFKVFTLAAALSEGKITPETEYQDNGFIQIGAHTLRNYNQRVFGRTNMLDVLERSINTGAIFAQRQIGNEIFLDYLEKFGFFELTNIDLHGEIFSQNLEFKKGYDVNFATVSYGQGINITLIQLLRALTSLVNEGRMVQPYIVDRINHQETIPVFSRPVISSQAANQATAMMISTIENGFSKRARIPGYRLAGKTGTSQVPWSAIGIDRRGYSDQTWQTFIGFGPETNPRFMILVKLDNPATRTAEYSAMPIFRDMAKYLIDYLKIPPDYDI